MELIGFARICISLFLLIYGLPLCNAKVDNEINWDRCNDPSYYNRKITQHAETICFVQNTCKEDGDFNDFVQFNRFLNNLKDKKCGVGMQIKPYTPLRWLVYLQVEKAANVDLLPEKGIAIYKDTTLVFGCHNDAGGVEYYRDSSLKIEKFLLANDVMSKDKIFCAFIVSAPGELQNHISDRMQGRQKYWFKFHQSGTEEVVEKPINIQWDIVTKGITCNPENAQYDTKDDSEMFSREVPITRDDDNDCDGTGEFLYFKKKQDDPYTRIQNISCHYEEKTNTYYHAYRAIEANKDTVMNKDEIFYVSCGAKVCTQCEDLDLPKDSTDFKSNQKGDPGKEICAERECKDNQWAYEDKNGKTVYTIGNITCKKSGDKAAWILKTTKEEIEVAKAGCTDKQDCYSKTPLIYGCPSNAAAGCIVPDGTTKHRDRQDGDIGCENLMIERKLEGKDYENITVSALFCNYSNGIWYADVRDEKKINQAIDKGSHVFCSAVSYINTAEKEGGISTGDIAMYGGGAALVAVVLSIAGVVGGMRIRRHRKYTPSEREMRKRPKGKGIHRVFPETLCVEDLAQIKEWPDALFDQILAQWLKFSIYERSKFAERIGFELGMSSNCQQYFKLFTRMFEIEVDYRVWQNVVPTFKLLHAQAVDKDNNLDTDKRMRKWCITQCKPIVEKLGFDGCNNEWRDTAYLRYIVFNLMYYCEDKEFTEKLLEHFDKGQFHGLHSLNRQIAWAAAVRDKDQFETARQVAEDAVVDKNAKREIAARRAKAAAASSGGWTKTKSKTMSEASGASGASSKSNKGGAASGKDKKADKGGSKEAKSSASKEGSKSNKSNRSNKSNKSSKEKKDKKGSKEKGSKETPSGKAKKGDSKEASKSGKSGRSGKDKKDKEKGGSKEAKSKGKSREKAGADEIKGESGKEKKQPPSDKPPSDKDKKKDKSEKDKKDSSKEKKTTSGKDKKTTSGKDKKSSKEKKSSKDKKSSKEKKSEKTCPSTKSNKSSKEKKSSKSSKEPKTMTAVDKSSKSAKSGKSKKTTNSVKKKKGKVIGYKERRDADGDKLHGDRAQHIFFAIGSSRSKEQIAAFLDWYIECKEYDPSNLVYLFAATLEWDDTRCYGLDLFVNMNKEAFKKMPPGDKYHMRIMKNFRKYVIGELDLQKIQDHLVRDPNYSAKHFGQINSELMLKRIHNNVTFQPKLVEDLDEALKKLNF